MIFSYILISHFCVRFAFHLVHTIIIASCLYNFGDLYIFILTSNFGDSVLFGLFLSEINSFCYSSYFWASHFVHFKPHPHLYANAKTHAKRIMWACRQTAFVFICLCSVCSANRQTLSVWSRYFKEKYGHHRTDVDIHSFGSQRIISGTLARSLVWQTLNKQLFGNRWHLPRSRMLCSHLCTDVNMRL